METGTQVRLSRDVWHGCTWPKGTVATVRRVIPSGPDVFVLATVATGQRIDAYADEFEVVAS